MAGYGGYNVALAGTPLMSIPEVARALNVSRQTVYRLIEDGQLIPVKVRGAVRLNPGEVSALVAGHPEVQSP